MSRHPQKGFTLIELMVSLAVAAILLGVGIPSFTGAIKSARLNKPWGELRHALYLARSEAVKGSRLVTVCARATDTTCGGDWDNGWLVFAENSTVADADDAVADTDGGTIMKVSESLGGKLDIVGYGSNDRTAGGATLRKYIRYNGLGRSNWQNGYFVVCDDRGDPEALGINVSLTGVVRSANKNGDGASLDVFNRELECP